MKKKKPFLLPVNTNDNSCEFQITSTVTQNSGTYEMVFLATENQIVDNNIDTVRMVFVSNTMQGVVIDNFIEDCVLEEELDANFQTVYDELLDLKQYLEEGLKSDEFKGISYIPSVDENGVISFERSDGKDEDLPEPRNITGPTGPYYIPKIQEGVLSFEKSVYDIPDVESVDLFKIITDLSNEYLSEHVDEITDEYLDAHLTAAASAAVDAKFKWSWDPDTQTLYIETENLESTPQPIDGVKF